MDGKRLIDEVSAWEGVQLVSGDMPEVEVWDKKMVLEVEAEDK